MLVIHEWSGTVADTKALGIINTFAVKQQTFKTAVEATAMLLRIDDIISGAKLLRQANTTHLTQTSAKASTSQQPPPTWLLVLVVTPLRSDCHF